MTRPAEPVLLPLSPVPGLQQVAWWDYHYKGVGSFIYAIQGQPGMPIKIGYSVDPINRLGKFNTASPFELSIIHAWPGDRTREREAHQMFSFWKMRNEWFGGEHVAALEAAPDAYAHHLMRDAATEWAGERPLFSSDALASIKSRAQLAQLRYDIQAVWDPAIPLKVIAHAVELETLDLLREVRIMRADDRYMDLPLLWEEEPRNQTPEERYYKPSRGVARTRRRGAFR